jgi:hypothetical protein
MSLIIRKSFKYEIVGAGAPRLIDDENVAADLFRDLSQERIATGSILFYVRLRERSRRRLVWQPFGSHRLDRAALNRGGVDRHFADVLADSKLGAVTSSITHCRTYCGYFDRSRLPKAAKLPWSGKVGSLGNVANYIYESKP